MSRTSPPFAPARLRLAYCESPLHFLSRTLFRHGRGFARAAFSSLVAGVVVSSLRRFARPATMPGDAISCNIGWPWGGARAPPVGPRSSRGGHGLLFGWANRRWTHPLRMAVTPRTQRIAAPNNSESYSRRHPNLHEAGPNGRRRRRPCPLDCGKERSSLLSPSLTSGHGTRNIPAWVMCSCGRRALLPARGYWSLGNFLRRSLVRAGCRRLALRLLRMSDAHLGTGTGGPLASSVQALP